MLNSTHSHLCIFCFWNELLQQLFSVTMSFGGERRGEKKKRVKRKIKKKKKLFFFLSKKKIFPSFQITHLINLSKCCAHLVQSKLLEDKNITRQLWDLLAPPSKELNYLLADKAGFCVCRLYVQKGEFFVFSDCFYSYAKKKKNPM